MAVYFYVQDPNEVLDYGFDWQSEGDEWLGAGETITSSTWTALDAGITVGSPSNTATTTLFWASFTVPATAVHKEYRVTNRITTNQGRTGDRTLVILCEEK